MILINGCSFSSGAQLESEYNRYSSLLNDMLGEKYEVRNISAESKDNYFSFFELYSYILHCEYKDNMPKPDIVIWQLTDYYRYNLPFYGASGSWKSNNWFSFLGNHSWRTLKTINWQKFFLIQDQVKRLKDEGEEKLSKMLDSIQGYGTQLLCEANSFPIGDNTFMLNQLRTGVNIKAMEQLCEQRNIRLIIVNYFPFDKLAITDPIIKSINYNNYLIENPHEGGLYNEMLSLGFDQPDNYHFGEDAHVWQATVLKRFIETNEKIIIRPQKELKLSYDYINKNSKYHLDKDEARQKLKDKLTK